MIHIPFIPRVHTYICVVKACIGKLYQFATELTLGTYSIEVKYKCIFNKCKQIVRLHALEFTNPILHVVFVIDQLGYK